MNGAGELPTSILRQDTDRKYRGVQSSNTVAATMMKKETLLGNLPQF